MEKLTNLRSQEESALKAADNIISEFAKKIKGKVFNNYRDYPSRTIYWRDGRTVKYIQIRLKLSGGETEPVSNTYQYDVFTSFYKTIFPILNFWNLRFDVNTEHQYKMGSLDSLFNNEELLNILDKSYSTLTEGQGR